MHHLVYFLLAFLLTALNTLDAVFTYIGIRSGNEAEGWPITAWFIRRLTLKGAMALKIVFVTAIAFGIASATNIRPAILPPVALVALCGVYLWVVIRNYRLITA